MKWLETKAQLEERSSDWGIFVVGILSHAADADVFPQVFWETGFESYLYSSEQMWHPELPKISLIDNYLNWFPEP